MDIQGKLEKLADILQYSHVYSRTHVFAQVSNIQTHTFLNKQQKKGKMWGLNLCFNCL